MSYVNDVYESVKARDPQQTEFLQAVWEVLQSLEPVLARNPRFQEAGVLERLCEPDRVIQFRVPWVDDRGQVRVNRGMRVQFNNAIGPY